MIEKLKNTELEKAVKVYNRGLGKQVPRWSCSLEETAKKLRELKSFVYKKDEKILGIVTFREFPKKKAIKLDFIYSVEMRRGVGRKLIKRVAKFALKNNFTEIRSEVSSKDRRVMSFYENCGFKRYGSHKVDENFSLHLVKAKPDEIP